MYLLRLRYYCFGIKVWDREKIVIIPDHYIFTSDERANRNVDILRDFCMEQNIKYFYDIKDLSDFKVWLYSLFLPTLQFLICYPQELIVYSSPDYWH